MPLISTHFAWNVQNQTDFAIAMQMRIIPWSIIINNGKIKMDEKYASNAMMQMKQNQWQMAQQLWN